MKQDLREALPKVRNPPSFKVGKNNGGFVKPAPDIRKFNIKVLEVWIDRFYFT